MDIESKLSELQLQIYDLIRSAGWEGKTVDELEVDTGKTHQSVSARVNELENYKPKPLIERRAAKRKTRSGRAAFIFVQAGLKRSNKESAVVATGEPRSPPMCSSCGRDVTDSPAGGCKAWKEHG